jgi:hypothetical protein
MDNFLGFMICKRFGCPNIYVFDDFKKLPYEKCLTCKSAYYCDASCWIKDCEMGHIKECKDGKEFPYDKYFKSIQSDKTNLKNGVILYRALQDEKEKLITIEERIKILENNYKDPLSHNIIQILKFIIDILNEKDIKSSIVYYIGQIWIARIR